MTKEVIDPFCASQVTHQGLCWEIHQDDGETGELKTMFSQERQRNYTHIVWTQGGKVSATFHTYLKIAHDNAVVYSVERSAGVR